jgi:hypothetical protein
MALPPKACFSFGEVFDKAKLRHLLDMSGLKDEVPWLAKKLGIPSSTLADLVSSTRNPDKQLHYKIREKWGLVRAFSVA